MDFGKGRVVAGPGQAFTAAFAKRCTAGRSGAVYPQVLVDGVFVANATGEFAFVAPTEFSVPNALLRSAGYDLRLWLDAREVPLSQLPGAGVGAWHASLEKGPHAFSMVHTDGRCWQHDGTSLRLVNGAFYGLWSDYGQPWSTYGEAPSALQYVAPGATTRQPLHPALFMHDPAECSGGG